MIKVLINRVEGAEDIPFPTYMTPHASGMDIYAAVKETLIVEPGKRAIVPTGFSIALPIGYEAQIRPRSGLAIKQGIGILNTPGTIDADYRGEIKIILIIMLADSTIIMRPYRRESVNDRKPWDLNKTLNNI